MSKNYTRRPEAERKALYLKALDLLQANPGRSVRSVAIELGIKYSTLCHWLKVEHGFQVGKRTHYTDAQKKSYVARARELFAQGRSLQQTARKLGLWKSTLYTWLRDDAEEELDEWHVLPSWVRMQKIIEATGLHAPNRSTPIKERRIPSESVAYLR
jgi:transposase-like protein